ncbi:MAG TPA: response regulator [Verrucomicrobiae bacterium]|nr:response regulator [Verrucomicrobiae bacterium]
MTKRVLVCDDEPAPMQALVYVVRKAGFEAITAQDGEEAARLAKSERPSLILLDIDMPRKDGYQVCEEIKSDPATRGIHVLILTAFAQEFQKEKARASGADEIMTKPFSPRRLRERILEILGPPEGAP